MSNRARLRGEPVADNGDAIRGDVSRAADVWGLELVISSAPPGPNANASFRHWRFYVPECGKERRVLVLNYWPRTRRYQFAEGRSGYCRDGWAALNLARGVPCQEDAETISENPTADD